VSKYKIVFVSTAIPEHHRQRVKSNLSIIFRVPVAKLAPLFQDRPVTIKKDLTLDEANRYRQAVEREGGICRVEPMSEGTSSMSMSIDNVYIESGSKAAAKSAPAADSDIITCPRCMTRQKPAPICSGCGVILQNYESEIRQQKASQKWVAGVDLDRRRGGDRRLTDDRRTDLRFQNDRRTGAERRASIAGWHRNRDAVRG